MNKFFAITSTVFKNAVKALRIYILFAILYQIAIAISPELAIKFPIFNSLMNMVLQFAGWLYLKALEFIDLLFTKGPIMGPACLIENIIKEVADGWQIFHSIISSL